MKDIGVVWDVANGQGDWATAEQDAAYAALSDGRSASGDGGADGDLVAAVLVSLFTDRRASDDFVPTDGTANRRGWWADAFENEAIGSRLWQLERAQRTSATLLQARDYCLEALDWLVRDGIAAAPDVLTFWAGRTTLGIRVLVTPVNSGKPLGVPGASVTIDTALLLLGA